MYSPSCVAVKNLGYWTAPVPVGAGGMTLSGLWQHTAVLFCISHWQEKPPAVPWMDTHIFQISNRNETLPPFSAPWWVPSPAVCRCQGWLSWGGTLLPAKVTAWPPCLALSPISLSESVAEAGFCCLPQATPKPWSGAPACRLRGRAAPSAGHWHFSGEALRHLALCWDMSAFEDTLASVLEGGSRPLCAAGDTQRGLWGVCAGYSEFRSQHSHRTESWWMLFLTQCHTPQHRRSLSEHDQVSLLLPVFGRDELRSPPQGDGSQCVRQCLAHRPRLPAWARAAVTLSMCFAHPASQGALQGPSSFWDQDTALQESHSCEHSGGQEDSAVSGTDPKGAHRTLSMDSCLASSPCPAGPAPAAINVGPWRSGVSETKVLKVLVTHSYFFWSFFCFFS